MFKLVHYARLLEAGCPVERHELADIEWLLLGDVRARIQSFREKGK